MHSDVLVELIALLRSKTAVLGAMDLASDQVEMPEEVAEVLSRALNQVDTDRPVPITDHGMTSIPGGAAMQKLGTLNGMGRRWAGLVSAALPSGR